jgi:hypothetical protein
MGRGVSKEQREILAWLAMLRVRDGDEGCWIPVLHVIEASGAASSTVRRSLYSLEQRGLVEHRYFAFWIDADGRHRPAAQKKPGVTFSVLAVRVTVEGTERVLRDPPRPTFEAEYQDVLVARGSAQSA